MPDKTPRVLFFERVEDYEHGLIQHKDLYDDLELSSPMKSQHGSLI
jgi:hypothetical protein